MKGGGLAASVQVRILDEVEFLGVHEFHTLPRVGEGLNLTRHNVGHRLTVREITHKIGVFGHSITLVCD